MPLKIYTTKDTVPASTAGTGNVSTIGTQYTTVSDNQLQVGDWIYDAAQDEARKVVVVTDANNGNINKAFSADLSAVSLVIIKKNDAKISSISVSSPSGGASTIYELDGGTSAALPASTSVNYTASDLGQEFLNPISVDGTTNNATVFYKQKGVDY